MKIIDISHFKRGTGAAILLMIVLTSAAYANSLRNSFAWDDYIIIVDNDFIKSWKNFPAIFSRSYLAPGSREKYLEMVNMGSGEMTYRPLVTVTYFIDYSLWRLNPFGYHLTNLILHIANLLLLYFLIGLITKDKRIALLASLFFGLHPINSEAVNGIAFREDLLAFLFYVSSFILFIRADACQAAKRLLAYIASLLFYLLALFSKEMAITLPVLLIVYDCYFTFPGKPKKILANLKSRYLGYIAASLIYLWVWFSMGDVGESWLGYPGGSFYTNLLTMSKAVATYIRWFFIPVSIHPTLPHDDSYVLYSFFNPEALLSVSVIAASLILALILYRKSRAASFAILWFFITLLPVLNIVPIINIMACRYTYIPTIGFCLLAAVLLCRLPGFKIFSISPDILKKISRDAVALLLIFYAVFTVIRNFAWRNSISFWLEMVEYYPDNAQAHRELGVWFFRNRLLDKAIAECRKAIDLDPGYALAYSALGACYGEKESYQEAIDSFKQAIRLNPGCAQAYYNLGVAYARIKSYRQAKEAFEKVLEIIPEHNPARLNLERLKQLEDR